jgi:hypothetical protein
MTPPPFGALVTNLLADLTSPQRRGYFVRAHRIKERGRFLPGVWWQLTDGNGGFWEVSPTVGGLALHPPRECVVEVDEATALAPLRGRVRSHG